MSRFSIGGVVYDALDLEKVSLRDILVFKQESAAMGLPMSWNDVQALTELDELDAHDSLVMMAVSVWVSRRAKGEPLTFEAAVSFPMTDFRWLDDPQDHKAKKANPTKAARKVSGRAAANGEGVATVSATPSPRTSSPESAAV